MIPTLLCRINRQHTIRSGGGCINGQSSASAFVWVTALCSTWRCINYQISWSCRYNWGWHTKQYSSSVASWGIQSLSVSVALKPRPEKKPDGFHARTMSFFIHVDLVPSHLWKNKIQLRSHHCWEQLDPLWALQLLLACFYVLHSISLSVAQQDEQLFVSFLLLHSFSSTTCTVKLAEKIMFTKKWSS